MRRPGSGTREGGLPKELRPLAAVVVLGAVMTFLDSTIVNVALTTLRADFGASVTTIGWVSTSYMLALAAAIPLTGWMAERFGPRRVWMTSVSCFVTASLLCGAAWSAESLIAFRVLQGLAGGMIMPVGTITIAQAAGPQRMGRVMSAIGVPMIVAPVMGPTVGGLLVGGLSWRAIFYVNIPLGIAGLLLARRYLPRERAIGRAAEAGHVLPPLDRIGVALLSPGVAAVIFAVSEFGQRATLRDPVVWVPGVLGVAAVTAFCVRALRIAHPLVDIALLRLPGFRWTTLTIFLHMGTIYGTQLLLPLFFQVSRGLSPVEAGLSMAPQGIGAAVGVSIGGRVAERVGGGPVVLLGQACVVLGTLGFALADAHTPYALFVPCMLVRGTGMGAAFAAAVSAGYATLERSQVPRATPIIDVLQRIGGAFGVALLTLALQSGLDGATGPAAQADAFSDAFTWGLIGFAAAAVPAVLLLREERRARRRAAAAAVPEEETPAPVVA
jgi:EmrB/QacA subfamily drug resistance transporter